MNLMARFRCKDRPIGLKWRSSAWFITSVVGFGVMTDLMVYSVIIPVVPFQLERLGYSSVSALTAWLLFAYSVSLVLSSPIFSWFSEKYSMRRAPLIWGLVSLIGFLVLFMEAPTYAVMVVARFVQGISSSAIWVVGLALLADSAPPEKVGQYLGFAMMGLTVGILAAPPIGGALYARFGFRAPFIFGIIFAAFDLLGRVFIIERKDALKWGHDPWLAKGNGSTTADSSTPTTSDSEGNVNHAAETVSSQARATKLPERKVWAFVMTHTRTLVGLGSVLIYGIVYTGLEPTLSLRLQALYNFDSTKVGLVILASAVAAVFASPLSGWISDRYGVEHITVICLTLAIPFYALMILRRGLALFIVCFAIANFMLAAVVSPLTSELANVVRDVEGIGYGHVYGFFNMAFGVGSAVGPLAAGQVYDHASNGWAIMLGYSCCLLLVCIILNFIFMGERPLLSRMSKKTSTQGNEESIDTVEPVLDTKD